MSPPHAKIAVMASADVSQILESPEEIYQLHTAATGPAGSLPLTDEMLRNWASGDLFGLSQDAGMGWNPAMLGRKEFLILSTSGGIRADDGTPIALGYNTGHWEVGLLMQAAAREFKAKGFVPFPGFCTDPCDGRTQGTVGMMDSLAYRNDAAIILRRLIRSLPTRRGGVGGATCGKGVPAVMMGLAGGGGIPPGLGAGGGALPPAGGGGAGEGGEGGGGGGGRPVGAGAGRRDAAADGG